MKRVVMDADGVCVDFTSQVLNMLATCGFKRRDPTEITMWDFLKELLRPDERMAVHHQLRHPDWWSDLEPMPGAQEAVRLLREAGHEVVFATAPWDSCSGWDVARRMNLAVLFGAKSSDVVITARKELVAGDAIVDDKPANVVAWGREHRHGYAFLYAGTHNTSSDWPRRISWPEKGVHELLRVLE